MCNRIVLGTYKTGKTARIIAKMLGADYSNVNETVRGYDFVFRYGNAYTSLGQPPRFLVNSLRSVELMCNKPRLRAMLLGNNVPAPRLFTSIDIRELGKDVPYPLIARPANHYKGKNFHLVENETEAMFYLRRGYYLQELVLKGQEYRIFIFGDRIFEVNLKEPRVQEPNQLIRNFGNGWRFKWTPWMEAPAVLRAAARQAAQVAGATFAAVDCCMAPGGVPYIFELNSGPGMSDNERKLNKLVDRIKMDYRRAF